MKRPRQASSAPAEQPQTHADVMAALPNVLFVPDVCRLFGLSPRTMSRLLRLRVFPIPELPALDRRHRWSRIEVERFLAGERQPKPTLLRHARSR